MWLHTCSTIGENTDLFQLTASQQHFFNVGSLVVRWTVPIFYMITGVLLLNPKKEIPYEQCIKKYAFRMLLALLVFGYPFAIIKLIGETKVFNISYLYKGLFNLLVGNTLSHLWYVYSLIGIYLILPILKAFINKASKKDSEYFLVI